MDDAQLSMLARTQIEDPANDVFVSPASYWEIAIKVRLGKLDLRSSYDDFMQRGIIGNEFAILPVEPRHTSLLTTLPMQALIGVLRKTLAADHRNQKRQS